MGMSPEDMKRAAASLNPYIRIGNGESFIGICIECDKVPNLQDPTKATFLYKFKLDSGETKFFKTTSTIILDKMSSLMGKRVQILRNGEGKDTRYEVFILDDSTPGKHASIKADEETPF